MSRTRLYFAYGSNCCAKQMRERCPSARFEGTAVLRGWALAFVGRSRSWKGAVATVERRRGHSVPGVLWRLTQEDFDRLDAFEGHPVVYRRKPFHLTRTSRGSGSTVAEVYVRPATNLGLPSEKYVATITRGLGAYGLASGHVYEAVQEVVDELAEDRATSPVFVYGTLMRGEGNHRVISKGSRFVEDATTLPQWTMVHLGGFPGLLPWGDSRIRGEVYEVDAECLKRLDRLEGHPSFYRRTSVLLAGGDRVETYVLAHPGRYLDEGVIPSGDWRHATRRRGEVG